MDPYHDDPPSVTVSMLQVMYQLKLQLGKLNDDSDVKTLVKSITERGGLNDHPERPKLNDKADRMRAAGNRFYLDKQYEKALYCYNESIAFAEPGTDRLGMGYANRSAVCFELGEYEMALFNVHMAKKHNYPEKLMPKLLQREQNCKQKIAGGHAKEVDPCPRMNVNVDVNPKIPFLAKGIALNYDPKFGRGLVAEKDFNPGDVISDEKIELCGIDFNLTFRTCNQCSAGEIFQILIPCPRCPFFMYCSEECLELNWKLYHRFECDVATKLCTVSRMWDMLTSRLFFYGLSAFGDNLQAMMEYCEKPIVTESNPLELDYTNLIRLEVFKALHNTKPRCQPDEEVIANNFAAAYFVVFLSNPVVKAIIRTERQRQFFLRSLVFYGKVAYHLSTVTGTTSGLTATIRPTGDMMNHSCDPQVVEISHTGRVKVIMLRPVRKGEQMFTSYGPPWFTAKPHGSVPFKCMCIVCDRQTKACREWHRMKERNLPQCVRKDLELCKKIFFDVGLNVATRLSALQQFIKRYSHFHPQREDLAKLLNAFGNLVYILSNEENMDKVRVKLHAEFVEK